MVLEKDKMQKKQLDSNGNMSDGIEEIDASSPSKQFEPGQNYGASPTGKNPNKIVFHASTKKKIQLTFEDVLIKTIPQQRKCCNKNAEPQKSKVILDNVSGTIQPGQFLAIIGASGKIYFKPYRPTLLHVI
jgi:ABC-type multidrug transport system fused ATPase/permease subunit